jgi:AraC-like DNA-binding protein
MPLKRSSGARQQLAPRRPAADPYDRRRLLAALESYLRFCYAARTAARVAEFAQHLGMSRPYVSRLYLRLTGESVSDLMRELQVQRAERLLRSSNRTTAEIAILAGFGTQMTLYRVFFALRHTTPDEYRHEVTK